MERVAKSATEELTLIPQADGWGLWRHGRCDKTVASLDEAAAGLNPKCTVRVVLPAHSLIFERLQLPATERAELSGMVRLQWEKMLPYAPEEMSGDFAIVTRGEKESTVLTMAASNAALDSLCQPLRALALPIAALTPSVCLLSAGCPVSQAVLAVFVELGELVVAVVEDRQPGWIHVFPFRDAERFAAELPQILLTASLEGIPTVFQQILLAPDAADLEPVLRQHFEAPIAPLAVIATSQKSEIDLVPAAWRSQAAQRQNRQNVSRVLLTAAAVYCFAIVMGWTHLWFLKREARGLDVALAEMRPQLEQIQLLQNRWQALAPAIDPQRYAIELLYLVERAAPANDVRLTEFDQAPSQWRVVGEASTPAQAVQYVARLKEDPELNSSQITAGPPQLIAGDKAQFSIFGKP